MFNFLDHKENANQNYFKISFTPVRISVIKNKNNECWWGCRRKRTIMHCWWEYKLVWPHGKQYEDFIKHWKVELLYGSSIPLLGICPKEHKIGSNRDTSIPMFIAELFTAQNWYPRTDKRAKKMWYIHTMKYYSTMKKNELLLIIGE
jgi:hypothetical protein